MTIHKALITGGTGFVGSNLAKRLVRDGWQVHIITIPNDNHNQIKEIVDQVTLHVHDGSTEGMNTIVADVKPMSYSTWHRSFSPNTQLIGEPLCGAMFFSVPNCLKRWQHTECTRIVNTGTSWQHYCNKPYSPVNLYAATKQAFEEILQYYVEAKGFKSDNVETVRHLWTE